jgi:ubiquinone/menaquinone biosynthesis C-methylase UbiE
MKIENKDFCEREDIIYTQDKSVKNTSNYEAYLYEKASSYFKKRNVLVVNAKIFGCGTGREIYGILNYISIDKILATDISENMIVKGKKNIVAWNLEDKVTMQVADAITFEAEKNSFELVTFMNNMLNYIQNKKDRKTVLKNAFFMLKPNGVLLGVVHNQVGTPQKTIYFFLRNLIKPFLKNEPGNRITGFKGYYFMGYYFKQNELIQLLSEIGFKTIEVKSLSDYYKEINLDYNRLKGYNNLMIFATK